MEREKNPNRYLVYAAHLGMQVGIIRLLGRTKKLIK
jgi:hypothetical protein